MVGFSKYEFYNKLLDGVTLLKVTPGVTWTEPLYIYISLFFLLVEYLVAPVNIGTTPNYINICFYLFSFSLLFWIRLHKMEIFQIFLLRILSILTHTRREGREGQIF